MYRLSDAAEELPRGEQYVQSYCTQVMQMWTECLKEQIKTKATLKTYCIDRCEYHLSKDKVKVMWGTQILNRMVGCSLDGNRTLHCRAFVSAFYPLLLSI